MDFTDSQDVFAQLGRIDGNGGVKAVIENHDAWTNAERVDDAVTVAVRAHLMRGVDPIRAAQIARQRDALATLVTRLPKRTAAAC